MRVTLRHLSLVVVLMFLSLMVATTVIQVFNAPSLNASAYNHRTIVRQNIANRGAIMIGKEAIALSKPSNDKYRYQRVYPQGGTYAAITGYHAPTLNALVGIEQAEGNALSGSGDSFIWQRLRTLLNGQESQGGSVLLTVNPAVQEAGVKAFQHQKGAAVAINPKTGAILSLISLPSYDPNSLSTHNAAQAAQTAQTLEEDPQKPLLNRALRQTYPPGSFFKVVTAAAMLEDGKTPETILDSPTQYKLPGSNHLVSNHASLPCGDGSGKTSLITAFAESCNTTFAIYGAEVGMDRLAKMAEKFGFDHHFEVPMRSIASRIKVPGEKYGKADAALAAFGQKDDQVSPLQAALIAATVANKGTIMSPYLVDQELSSDLSVVSTTTPKTYSQVLSPQVASQLTEMMKAVVADPKGTGTRAQIPGVPVAGKTGTAEQGSKVEPHSWFIGFAPADNPQIAVAVIVEFSGEMGEWGSGGDVAAPIARAMMEAAIEK